MYKHLKELYRYRELLFVITWRDIRIKYKQSIMGFLWAILMPTIIVMAGVLVKFGFSLMSHQPFTLSQIATVSVKSLPWAFVVSSLRFATNSLVGNSNLVTKIYFPKEIFPLSAVLSQFFDFLIATIVLVVILSVAGIGFSIHLLWLPALVLILFFLVTGLGTLMACANLFFRDIKYIVEVILTFGIFFTPVFYEASMFEKYETLVLLNPVAPILEAINDTVIRQQMPDLRWVMYSALFALIVFAFAFSVFKKLEPTFAENI